MKIEISKPVYQELGSLSHGDVFRTESPRYGIVSDLTEGDKVGILMLDTGDFFYINKSTRVVPTPNAYLQVM